MRLLFFFAFGDDPPECAWLLRSFVHSILFSCSQPNSSLVKSHIALEDVFYIRDKYIKDEEWLKEGVKVMSNPFLNELERANQLLAMLPDLESTVMPKFIIFLAKKNRLKGLKRILLEYVQAMYFYEKITPVKVTAAQRLDNGQIEKIKDKMKAKASACFGWFSHFVDT